MNADEFDKLVDLIKKVANRTHQVKPVFNFYGVGELWDNLIQFEVDWIAGNFFREMEKKGWKIGWIRVLEWDKLLITLERSSGKIEITKDAVKMKGEKEIEQAILDSKKYFKEEFPEMELGVPYIQFKDLEKGLKSLAVSNEICTLNWILGRGKLNCYGDKK